ncbi:hypothetical protein ABK040_013939 [Willaertia magna]
MAEENAVNRDEFEDEISLGSDEQRKTGINWAQLEQKFVEIITQLNSPPQTKGTLTTAEQKSDFVKQLQLGIEAIIEVTLSESSMFMNEQNYEKAFEGGLKALTFIQRAYGKDSIHQVEAYFLLSKACQLMKKFKQAEEYLSIANWTVVKNRETCPLGLRAELHQHFGLLYVQQKKTKEAMENMAASVYYLALQNGTRDLITSFAYYNLGNAFVALQNKIEKGIAFMKKVIDIWHDHLLAHLKSEELDKEEYKYSNNLKDLEEDKILDAKRIPTPPMDYLRYGLEKKKERNY